MNNDFWKQFANAPRIDCVQMKHDIQEQIFTDTQGMTPTDRATYRERRAIVFRTGNSWQPTPALESLVLREEPPES